MSKYYVTGGRQREDALKVDEWFSYGQASIYSFDSESGLVTHCVDYHSPDDVRPDEANANVVFKAGSLRDKNLLVCTQTEILEYSLPGFERVGYMTHPWFNDLHHVAGDAEGNFLVANTGLDMVLVLGPDGAVVNEYSAIPGADTWKRFDRDVDYRKIVTTKPHDCHPNYIFNYKGELWISRFVQRDLMCITNPAKRIDIGEEKTHDGNVFGENVFCTTVNGFVFVSDLNTCRVVKKIDLNRITGSNKVLGWCRGLHIIDENRIIVGFSRLRQSKVRENLRWVRFKMGLRETSGGLPTRVVCINIKDEKIEWTIDLQKHGMNAVFSILPAQ